MTYIISATIIKENGERISIPKENFTYSVENIEGKRVLIPMYVSEPVVTMRDKITLRFSASGDEVDYCLMPPLSYVPKE